MRPAIASLALLGLLLVPLTLRADDGPSAAPPAAQTGDREYWISILATPLEIQGKPAIKVEGQSSFPEGTVIDLTVEHRGQPSDLMIAARPVKGAFQATFEITRPVLPGYYQVKAAFAPWRQDEPLSTELADFPVQETFYPILFGSLDEAKKVSEAALVSYEREIASIETIFGELRKFYQEVLKRHDLQKSPEEWNGRFGNVPEDIQKEIARLQADGEIAFLPAYPLLHNWAVEGWGTLLTAYATLTEGVVVEITEMMSRKHMDRQFFLKKADELIGGYMKGMHAQIFMERNGELRERLVYQTGRLLWLSQHSSKVYRASKEVQAESVRTDWQAFIADARKELDPLAKDLKAHSSTELAKQYPQLLSLLLRAPDALRRTWELYDRVLVNGTSATDLAEKIAEGENECYLCIVPAIEVLGFKREAVNRMMQRGFAAGGSGDKAAKEVPLSDDPDQRMGEYLQSKIEGLGSGSAGERLQSMRVILQMGAGAKEPLRKAIESNNNGPEVVAMAHVCLARIGDVSSETAVVSALRDIQDDGIRAIAASTLGILGRRRYVEPLGQALAQDKGPTVRAAAARALQDLKTVRAIPLLISALSDAELIVRQAALTSLETLAAKKMNFNPDAPQAARTAQLPSIQDWWKANSASLLAKEPPDDPADKKPEEKAAPAEKPASPPAGHGEKKD
ncbi:MAG: HEAT repeat domain-containing protein [Planctomycetes bacterium]|nr:HEAT repeat domain-containing protein [Planctomycetota bacterium]